MKEKIAFLLSFLTPLPQKPKIKNLYKLNFRNFLSLFALILIMGGGVLFPRMTSANTEADGANCTGDRSTSTLDGQRVCMISHVVLNTDVLVNGQSANTVKIGPNDNVVFTVQVKLVSPPDLNVSTGLGVNPATYRGDYAYVPGWTFNVGIAGFGATIVPQNTTNFCGTVNGYAKCQSAGDTTQGATFEGSKGPFDSVTEQPTLTNYKAGDVVYSHQFTITPNSFKQLGITNNSGAGAYGINQIFAYPDLALNFRLSSDDWTTFQAGGKAFFVQLYPSEQAMQNDASSVPPVCSGGQNFGTNTPPTCVPPNGSNTSAGNDIKNTSAVTGLISLINQIIGVILALIQELIFALFSILVAPLIEALLHIHPYTDSFVAVIYPGWIVVRNLCNIFFIVALIIIAMATLFRVESYQFRHLLVQLIIAALLVNFSLVIGQAILGLADTVQTQFLGNNIDQVKAVAGNLMLNSNSVLQNYFSTSQNANAAVTNQSFFAGIIQSIFWLSLSLGTFAVFVAICAFLFIRIVALWILLLISPVAYAAGALPATAKYRGEWWQQFLKYAFFTPIMAFFLNMTAIMVKNAQQNPIFSQALNGTSSLTSGSGAIANNLASLLVSVGSDVMLLIFLIASLKVAEQAGIYGAAGITGIAQKGIFLPLAAVGKAIKGGSGAAAGAVARFYSGTLATKAFDAVQAEVQAKQDKTALQAEQAIKQRKLSDLLATPAPNQEQVAQLQHEIAELGEQAHEKEHEEHRQGRRKRNLGLMQFLNPVAAKKGWEARKHILENRAYKPAEGLVHDTLNRYMPTEWGIFHKGRHGLGRITDFGFVDKLGVIREEAKHLENLSINRNFAVYAMDNAAQTGSWEERMGQGLLIAKQNQQDDVANIANKDNNFIYTGYNDLMYLKNKVWSTMSPQAQQVMAVQLLEQQETDGRGRSMFFNEDRNATVADLSYMADRKGFDAALTKAAIDLDDTNDPASQAMATRLRDMRGTGTLSDIVDKDFNPKPGMEKVHEAIISSDVAGIYAGKTKRGEGRKWLKSMNPAEVREQTTRGWEKYTMMGLMKIKKAPKTLLQTYLRRTHEGEARTAVYGGAMVDLKTKEIRMPRSPEKMRQLQQEGADISQEDFDYESGQYDEWKRVIRARPELGAATATNFVHPNKAVTVLDKIISGEWRIDANNPEAGIVDTNGNLMVSFDPNIQAMDTDDEG